MIIIYIINQKYLCLDYYYYIIPFHSHAEIKEFSRVLAFDRRFNEADPLNVIPASALESYRTHVREIRAAGIDKKLNDLFNMEMCLVHGDCHYKAIFTKDGRVSVSWKSHHTRDSVALFLNY